MGSRPFDDVEPVALFIAVGLELTVGRVSTSNIDEEDEIPALGGLDGEFGLSRVVFLAVGSSINDRRKAPGCVGAEQCRPQPHAIAQRNLDSPLHDDVRILLEHNRSGLG